jgi:hypothetical protein
VDVAVVAISAVAIMAGCSLSELTLGVVVLLTMYLALYVGKPGTAAAAPPSAAAAGARMTAVINALPPSLSGSP